MTGTTVRAIRRAFDLSTAELARVLRATSQEVAQWEASAQVQAPTSVILALEYLSAEARSLGEIEAKMLAESIRAA